MRETGSWATKLDSPAKLCFSISKALLDDERDAEIVMCGKRLIVLFYGGAELNLSFRNLLLVEQRDSVIKNRLRRVGRQLNDFCERVGSLVVLALFHVLHTQLVQRQ